MHLMAMQELWVLVVILSFVAMFDARNRRVPRILLLLLWVSGLGFAVVKPEDCLWRLESAIAGLVFLSAVLVFWTALMRRTGSIARNEFAMGWADPIIFGGIGSFVGLWGLPYILWLASIQGLILWLLIPNIRRAPPFGAFMAISAIEFKLFSNWL